MYVFLFETAPNILRAQRQYLLLHWLEQITFDTAGYKIIKLRLHYERRTWPEKFRKIQELCQNITGDSIAIGSSLQSVVSNATTANLTQITPRMNTLLRRDLVELHRLLGYEVRYSQYLATECLIRTADNPGLLRKSIGILQEHLQTTTQRASNVLLRLGNIRQIMAADPSSRFAEAAEESQAMYVSIRTELTALDMVMQLFRGDATAGEGSSTRGPLASVPIVRRKLQESAGLQQAALQAYSQISERTLKRIVRTWLNILAVNEDLRNDTAKAIDEVEGRNVGEIRRARDKQTGLMLALQYLDRQEQLEANRALGLKRTLEDDLQDTKLQEAMENSGIANSDIYKRTFTEEEQDRLKRRRID